MPKPRSTTCVHILSVMVASMLLLSGTVSAAPVRRGNSPDPNSLALKQSDFPAGAIITRRRIDRTAKAVDNEHIFGNPDNTGDIYAKLHFLGTLAQRALLPRFNGKEHAVFMIATVFPSVSAATQAFSSDSNFSDNACSGSPPENFAIPVQTCTYSNQSETGMCVIGTADRYEFVVIAYVHSTGASALTRVVRDASYVASHEVNAILHLLKRHVGKPGHSPQHVKQTATPLQSEKARTPNPTTSPTVNTPVPSPSPSDTPTPSPSPSDTPTPLPSSTPAPTPTATSTVNANCPNVLTDQNWGPVNMRPDLYINCQVDIVGQLGHTQVLDNSVNYVLDLDYKDPSTTWTVFAVDYDSNPPNFPDGSYVHVVGYIEDSVGAYVNGAYTGNVPQVHVGSISVTTGP